jgi:hypothetical protein
MGGRPAPPTAVNTRSPHRPAESTAPGRHSRPRASAARSPPNAVCQHPGERLRWRPWNPSCASPVRPMPACHRPIHPLSAYQEPATRLIALTAPADPHVLFACSTASVEDSTSLRFVFFSRCEESPEVIEGGASRRGSASAARDQALGRGRSAEPSVGGGARSFARERDVMVEAAGVEPAESERKPQQNRPFALICPSLCPRVTRRSPTGEARR